MAQISITLPPAESMHSWRIPLHLTIHAEARRNDEVWSGKANPATRRKLQNRLNQRSHRRRKAEEKASKVQVFEIITPSIDPAQQTAVPPVDDSTLPHARVHLVRYLQHQKAPPFNQQQSSPRHRQYPGVADIEPILLHKGLTAPSFRHRSHQDLRRILPPVP